MARPPGWQWKQRLRRPSPVVLLLPLVLLFWMAAAWPPASSKGFGLLEWANKVVPQKAIVKTARFSWNMLWKV